MNRRDFITLLGGAAAWPLAARAQQSALPVMGFLDSGSETANAHLVAALRQGLKETGHVEGQNLKIEYRWAEGDYDRLPALAAELVRIPVAVLATGGGEPAARAAQTATTTIPIVFDAGTNPVELGMVASLNRPGGKLTGVNQMVEELGTKQLGLLHELVPQAQVLGMLVDPNTSRAQNMVRNAQTAARVLGLNLEVLTAADEPDFYTAFTALARQHIGSLFVAPAPFFYNRRDRIIALAARHAIPTLYVRRATLPQRAAS
jgi:putative ABC transport system substrate-binding protein